MKKKLSLLVIFALAAIVGFAQTPTTITAKRINATQNIVLRNNQVDSISTDTTLSANANNVLSTQKAIKTYIKYLRDTTFIKILGGGDSIFYGVGDTLIQRSILDSGYFHHYVNNGAWVMYSTSSVILTTISTLRALTTIPTGVLYYITDPGQQGLIYYNASDVTSTDNGGTIFVTSGNQRMYRQFSGAVNVQWFGAKDDNSTDAQIAINKAIAFAAANNMDLYFPVTSLGIYKILTYPGTTNNVLFDFPTGLTGNPIRMKIYGDRGVIITTALDSNTASQLGCRIFRVNGAYNDLTIENIYFQNTHTLASSGNYTGAINLSGSAGNLIKNVIIRGCVFNGFSSAIVLNGVNGGIIYNNRFISPLGHDNATNSTQPASYITGYCNSNGLTINMDIHDNYSDGYTGTDITTTTTRAPMDNFVYGTMIGSFIHHNIIKHFGTEGISVNQYNSFVYRTDQTLIEDNEIYGDIVPGSWYIGGSTPATTSTAIRIQAINPLIDHNALHNTTIGIVINQQGVLNYPFSMGGIYRNTIDMADSGQGVPTVAIEISGYGSGTTNHNQEIAYNAVNFKSDSLKGNARVFEIDYSDSTFMHHNTVNVYNLVKQSYTLNWLNQTGSASTFLRGNQIIGRSYFDLLYNESTSSHVNIDSAAFGTTFNGLVPSPGSISGKYLRDDGTWGSPSGGSFSYTVATAVNTANYTVTTATYVILPDLTGQANRTIALPTSPASGTILVISNLNTLGSGFNWSFTNGTVKDNGQNTITNLAFQSKYQLVFNGTNWDITN